MTILMTWGNPDPINLLILVVYAIMAILMYQTFKESQRQTTYTLAMNQYNIFNKEIESFFNEATNMKFKSTLSDELLKSYHNAFERCNGVFYIHFFPLPTRFNSEHNEDYNTDFRENVLFPLTRFYDKLYKFILKVESDKLLTNEYKNSLLYTIERDILQTYFRVCNNQFGNEKTVDLNIFKTIKYIPKESFLRINDYYISKNKFQFENYEFYKETF